MIDKISDSTAPWMLVVAGALQREDGLWLMHQRPAGKAHAGLWEFPGGKVEPSEFPQESLVRELHEELGIRINSDSCETVSFAEQLHTGHDKAIVLLLYRISDWEGDPQALEGGAVGWFTPAQIAALDKPPLDSVLSERLFSGAE